MHAGALRALEYDRIVEAVRRFALTPPGAARLAKLQPLTDARAVAAALAATARNDAFSARRRRSAPGARGSRRAADVARGRRPRARAAIARQPRDVSGVGRRDVRRRSQGPQRAFRCSARSPRRPPRSSTEIADIRRKIGPAFEVVDDASPELATLRDRLRKQRARLRGTLESYLRGRDTSKYLQQQIVTDRNGRYVLVVRSEHRAAIPGIVHGSSGSGASLFLEPLSTVEINNDIVALEQQETEEVRRILLALADALRRRAGDLHAHGRRGDRARRAAGARAVLDCSSTASSRRSRATAGSSCARRATRCSFRRSGGISDGRRRGSGARDSGLGTRRRRSGARPRVLIPGRTSEPEPRARAPSPGAGRRPRDSSGPRAGGDGTQHRRQDRRAQDGRAPAA